MNGRPFGFGADEILVAEPVIDRGGEAVGAAARHGVDAGADEVALAHIERRDVHLHLLDGFERDRRDARALAGRARKAERVVEVRSVDGDVVQAIVLTAERHAAILSPICACQRLRRSSRENRTPPGRATVFTL